MSLLSRDIAFKPGEAVSARTDKRQSEKKMKGMYIWKCPSCGLEEYGGRTAVVVNFKNEEGKMVERRIPRQCPNCGCNMVKTNPYKVK